jgi:type IX secretion system PorP/SprF family membrane protein
MRNKSWLLILSLFIVLPAVGQERPIYNHFYANPFLYNSAFAGEDYRPSIYISHRRQWVGFEGAPVTSNLVFHTPLRDKFAFGLQFGNDTRGLLSSSSGLITFAYKAMFNPEHFLKFGLSGGITNRSLTGWDEIMNDPRYQDDEAVLKLLQNSMYLDGRFGFNYHNKGLNMGITLPRLFSNDFLGSKEFNEGELNPLNSYQFMVHYKTYNKTAPVSFEPYLIYRLQGETLDYQIEGAGIIRIKNALWLGAIYRQNAGLTSVGGFSISDALHFGYSYDIGAQAINSFSKGTHEIMLKLNLGEERRPKKRERQIVKKEIVTNEEHQQNRRIAPIVQDETLEDDVVDLDEKITNYKGPFIVREGNKPMDLKKGYYVVAGVFRSLDKAEAYNNSLFQLGYYTRYGFSSSVNYYFVYIYYSDSDKNSAEAVRKSLSQRSLFGDSWILTVE